MAEILREALQKTILFFEKKGVPQPRLSAEWLFAEGLGCKRLDLYLRHESILEEPILNRLREWVVRRANREPWQYIVGHTPFLDIDLITDARALIPRPETELLVANILENTIASPMRILDLGTGSGAIALALAKACKEAVIVAVDKNENSLALARLNAQRLDLTERIDFRLSNWFSAVDGHFDWIVANPPYLTPMELKMAEPEVKDYEPLEALVAANDGRSDLELILNESINYLSPGGQLFIEMGIAHGEWILNHAHAVGYKDCKVTKDWGGYDRFFEARSNLS
jgi:release factor glutamine methyltransferase